MARAHLLGVLVVFTGLGCDAKQDDAPASRCASRVGAPSPAWSRAPVHTLGRAQSVATDRGGGVLVTGQFQGTLELGGGPLDAVGSDVAIFVASFDQAGAHRFSRAFGAGGHDRNMGMAIAADCTGDVVVTGYFDGNIDFGGGTFSSSMHAAQAFVAKLDATGRHVWSKALAGSGAYHQGMAVAAGPNGEVVVGGLFVGTIDLDGAAYTQEGPGYAGFVVEYGASGEYRWSRLFSSPTGSFPVVAVGVDAAGNVAVGGYAEGIIDLGGGSLSTRGTDAFVAKYAPDGGFLWGQVYGDGQQQIVRALVVLGNGDLAVAGELDGSLDLGTGPLTSVGSPDVFLARISASGTALWAQRFGGAGAAVAAPSLASGPSDSLWLSPSSVSGDIDFGGGALGFGDGMDHVLVAQFDGDGVPLASAVFGPAGSRQTSYGVAVDASGQAVVVGAFMGAVMFEDATHAGSEAFVPFVAKLGRGLSRSP